MAWYKHPLERLLGVLRFLARGTWIINLIILGFFSIYLTAQLCRFLFHFLQRTTFASPW